VGRRPQICHPDRSGGTCSFTFGHSKSAAGESPPDSASPSTQTADPSAALGGCDFIDCSREVLDFQMNRHPERSASPIDRVTQRLWRGVEGPRRCLIYPCCSELFHHRVRTAGPATVFPWGPRTKQCMKRCTSNHKVRVAADPVVVRRWWKGSEQHG
jgi:hypothetical protein